MKEAAVTRYTVPGWGSGEVWSRGRVLLAHDFDFVVEGGPARVAPLGTMATYLEGRSEPPQGGGHGVAGDVVRRVRRFLEGDEVSFSDVEIDLGWATPFQRALTEALRRVAHGETVSYGELAALAGYPGAARAAGTFCARNRFAFVVPCHRVVAADGLGGYGAAGVAVKRRLLELERVEP